MSADTISNKKLSCCVIPGGKTCHIGGLMKGHGVLIAVDKAQKKIDTLRRNLDASGCQFAQVLCFDSAKLVDVTG